MGERPCQAAKGAPNDALHKTFPSPLREYSVIYTDRALNLMAKPFTEIMQTLSNGLKKAYNADHSVIIPGSGSYGMESVARQFATGEHAIVLRNGYFSYRWSDIFERCGGIVSSCTVLKGQIVGGTKEHPQFAPHPIDEAVATIKKEKPAVVFAPHVETSTGILLSPEYIKQISAAVHSVGGVFVLDGVASGTVWVNLRDWGVDCYLTAPQKGWTGPACCGIVMLSERGRQMAAKRKSTSMVLDLVEWLDVMHQYEAGGFKYYTTLPTDALVTFAACLEETFQFGLKRAEDTIFELGMTVRKEFEARGFQSVAAPGWQSPGVVVSYTPNPNQLKDLIGVGIQVAGGVPLKLEPSFVPAPNTMFRIGLFGLDKLKYKNQTINTLLKGIDDVASQKAKL